MFSLGRYKFHLKPPYPLGFEAAGEVVAIGKECPDHHIGDAVVYMADGTYSEYTVVPAQRTIPIPKLEPEYVPLMLSGLTASMSLDKLGDLKEGNKVLVTAAAGGTGQFAVQLARLAGCHVIGTCSTDKKVEFLRSIGCHRPINYKREDLMSVLKKEYPKGVDVVYESVGGEVFNTCMKNLSIGGRLIVIGLISHYQQDSFNVLPTVPIQQILLTKSASMRGFFLPHFNSDVPAHAMKLMQLFQSRKIKSAVDLGTAHRGGAGFKGLPAILDAVDYLYSAKNVGKILVDLDYTTTSKL